MAFRSSCMRDSQLLVWSKCKHISQWNHVNILSATESYIPCLQSMTILSWTLIFFLFVWGFKSFHKVSIWAKSWQLNFCRLRYYYYHYHFAWPWLERDWTPWRVWRMNQSKSKQCPVIHTGFEFEVTKTPLAPVLRARFVSCHSTKPHLSVESPTLTRV